MHLDNQHLVNIQFTFLKTMPTFTVCLLVSSADNLCKQFGSRSGPMVFLKECFEKDGFEKNLQATKHMQRIKSTNCKVNID